MGLSLEGLSPADGLELDRMEGTPGGSPRNHTMLPTDPESGPLGATILGTVASKRPPPGTVARGAMSSLDL